MTAGTSRAPGQASWSNVVTATTGTGIALPTATTAYSNFGTASYGGSLFGKNGPSYLDVQQGAAGDCWLLASLAEVAARDPQDIKNMFSWAGTAVDQNGVVDLYTVRFYNSKNVAEYVAVDAELPAGGGTYDHPVNGVPWVALAEKAYAEANSLGYVTTQQTGKDSYAALERWRPGLGLAGHHREAGQRLRRQPRQPRHRVEQERAHRPGKRQQAGQNGRGGQPLLCDGQLQAF